MKHHRPGVVGRVVGGNEPFILTAMASLMVANVWMFRERELLLGHFYRPEMLSIVHTLTLGWITMLMMGVLVRLSPRAMGVTHRSRRVLLLQFLLMFIGYTGMVFHFWISGFWAMALSASLIVLAALVQLYNFSGCFSRIGGTDWLPRYVAAAMVNLVLAGVLGVILGFNKVYDLWDGEFFPSIFAHVHLAAVGWVSMMIVGFEHRLLPATRPAPHGIEKTVRFWFLEIGVLGLAFCLLLASPWSLFFAIMTATAFILHLRRPVFLLLRGQVKDRASFWATVALVFLFLSCLTGVLLSLGIPAATSPLRIRVQLAYGYSGFLGWITLTIAAQVYKLFPMFVWEERFQSRFGREPVPAMKDLYSSRLQWVSSAFLAVGVLGASVGIVGRYLPAITFFHGMVILGVATFIANFFLMARWALLGKAFHPTEADWEHFHRMFPKR